MSVSRLFLSLRRASGPFCFAFLLFCEMHRHKAYTHKSLAFIVFNLQPVSHEAALVTSHCSLSILVKPSVCECKVI